MQRNILTHAVILNSKYVYLSYRSVSADHHYELDREGSNEIIPPPRYIEFLKAERNAIMGNTVAPPRYIEVRQGRIVLESQKINDLTNKTDGDDHPFVQNAKEKLHIESPTTLEPPDDYERSLTVQSEPQSPVYERGKHGNLFINSSYRSEPCKNTVSMLW